MSIANITVENEHDLYANNLYVLSTTDSSNISTGGLLVDGGCSIKKNLIVGQSIHVPIIYADTEYISDVYHVSSTANSTSTSTGSLTVQGGFGLCKDMYAGGDIHVLSTTTANSSTSGALQVAGGISSQNNIVGLNLFSFNDLRLYKGSDYTTINRGVADTEISSSTQNHPIIFNDSINYVEINSTLNATDTNTGSFLVNGGVNIAKNMQLGGQLFLNNTTDTVSTMTGALVISGGMSIGKSMRIAQNLEVDGVITGKFNVSDTSDATSTTTGSMILSGGLGVAKNIYAGGNINANGSCVATSTTVYSGNMAEFTQRAWDGGNMNAKSYAQSNGHYYMNGNNGLAYYNFSNGWNTIYIRGTTISTSYDTGSLIIGGGMGISKNLCLGSTSTIQFDNSIRKNRLVYYALDNDTQFIGTGIRSNELSNQVAATSNNFTYYSGTGTGTEQKVFQISGNVNTGSVNIYHTTQATSTSAGSLIVSGGVGIAKDLYVGGTIYGSSLGNFTTIDSTSTSTGALVIAGGVGIAKKLYVGSRVTALNMTCSTAPSSTTDVVRKTDIPFLSGYTSWPLAWKEVGNLTNKQDTNLLTLQTSASTVIFGSSSIVTFNITNSSNLIFPFSSNPYSISYMSPKPINLVVNSAYVVGMLQWDPDKNLYLYSTNGANFPAGATIIIKPWACEFFAL